ncbi:MAG: IS110 family transposase [Nitrososphaerota archaeon]|nr:IS110 family transposase [Nitrososphaerota archaeon]
MMPDQAGALYIGADVHERESQLAIFEPSGSPVVEKRIPTGDLESFLGSLPGEKHVAMEAVGFIYPIYDRLTKLPSCHVSVADPNNVRLIAKSRLKHDKADARVLGELLRTNFFPVSYMADEETREKRLLINDRVGYGLRRGQLRTTIRWLLKRRGIEVEKVFSVEGRSRLRALRLRELDIRLDELQLVESIIERLDGEISSVIPMDANAALLDTIPGVAPYTALFLSSAIGDIDRFQDSKHLCAFLGLVPSLHQSGDVRLTGHITQSGDRFLRRNMVECARVAVRRDTRLREFYLRLRRERGEKKALVAVARKMVAHAYWMLKRMQTYEELSPWFQH